MTTKTKHFGQNTNIKVQSLDRKRILHLSWRDIRNPAHGGAEVYTHEVLHRLVSAGHDVTLFTAMYPGALSEEIVDGVKIIRQGNFFSVHKLAINFYKKNSEEFDLVIDELHGYPFLANMYVSQPSYLLVHEVAGRIWFDMWPLPIAFAGMMFERLVYALIKNQNFITVSESTKLDLIAQGISERNINLIHVGNAVAALPKAELKSLAEKKRQICFVGRVCKMKGVDKLLLAFSEIAKSDPELKLILVGKVNLHRNVHMALITKQICHCQ